MTVTHSQQSSRFVPIDYNCARTQRTYRALVYCSVNDSASLQRIKSIVNFKNLPEHSILLILLFWGTATLGRLSASPIPSDHGESFSLSPLDSSLRHCLRLGESYALSPYPTGGNVPLHPSSTKRIAILCQPISCPRVKNCQLTTYNCHDCNFE